MCCCSCHCCCSDTNCACVVSFNAFFAAKQRQAAVADAITWGTFAIKANFVVKQKMPPQQRRLEKISTALCQKKRQQNIRMVCKWGKNWKHKQRQIC